jgi:tetratricopeptide (TPR) repeat protein
MACNAKGLRWECRQALETVAAANPEDSQVQRMLGKMLAGDGKIEAAKKAFRTILDFNPADLECREELQTLEQAYAPPVIEPSEIPLVEVDAAPAESAVQEFEEDDEIIDLLESDIVEEFELEEMAPPAAVVERPDPLSTATLAELYIQQGFTDKALDIYHALYAEDPTNRTVQVRIAEIEAREAATAAFPVMSDGADTISGTFYQDSSAFPQGIPVQGTADDVISTLEGWLENIRRIKACR